MEQRSMEEGNEMGGVGGIHVHQMSEALNGCKEIKNGKKSSREASETKFETTKEKKWMIEARI